MENSGLNLSDEIRETAGLINLAGSWGLYGDFWLFGICGDLLAA